jgi:hypothetical protein
MEIDRPRRAFARPTASFGRSEERSLTAVTDRGGHLPSTSWFPYQAFHPSGSGVKAWSIALVSGEAHIWRIERPPPLGLPDLETFGRGRRSFHCVDCAEPPSCAGDLLAAGVNSKHFKELGKLYFGH